MKRLIGLIGALAGALPLHAQESPRPYTNSLGMKFVWIPPGTFLMGSPPDEPDRRENEVQHHVRLTRGFYMGAHLVTQEQWQAVMGINPSHFDGEKNLPVERVSWTDCQEFIKKVRAKDKKLYRLPTEAEWEYACRAGTTTAYAFGATLSTDQANFNGSGQKGRYLEKTTPIDHFPANAWGLHDMHGNLIQWLQDWHGEYPAGKAVDPQGPAEGKLRSLRGGSWFYEPRYCRSAYRCAAGQGARAGDIGVRLCFFPE